MSRALRSTLRRSIALLLLAAAVGLTIGAPLHARHDAADPSHQRSCVLLAWTKSVHAAAVTPAAALALDAAPRREPIADRYPSFAERSRPTPQARAPPAV